MSTERVDHAATAHALLVAADSHPHDPDIPVDPWTLQAQVHATLALVEQQRIGNIIALLGVPEQYGSTTFKYLLWRDGKMNSEIAEALGLT